MSPKVAQKIDGNGRKKKIKAPQRKIAKAAKPQVVKKVAEGPALTADTREELIIQNRARARKLARSILRKWHSRLDLEEVDSIVDLSLCEAAQRFNPEMGAGFMTFLFYHLRGNLIRAVTVAATANALPAGDVNASAVMDTAFDSGKTAAYQTATEIATALCSDDYVAPDEALAKKEMVNLSQEARSHLDYLEREVIERIYMNEEQLLDIAYDLGYSRCHISRIKRKALEALYDGIASLVGSDVMGERPSFDDDEKSAGNASRAIRRKAVTRRPRSQRAQRIQFEAVR